MTFAAAVAEAISAATGEPFSTPTLRPIGGGDIHQAFGASDGARHYFVKANRAERLPMFEAEADALHALTATRSVRAPQPLCSGAAAGQAFLVLEHLDLRGQGDAALLGAQLAQLHRAPQSLFGWACDNWVGSTPQPNGWRQFIVGYSSREENGTTIGYAVRWDRSSGTWQPTQIPSGGAVAVSDSGAVVGSVAVAGSTTERRARVWTDNGTIELPGTDTRANGVSDDGTVVVGYRLEDVHCRRPPCGKYEVAMVWTLQGGTWVGQELIALDGVDGEASVVAEVNGRTVIVGYGYTKKDAIMRAVYWQADEQGSYGPPMRLAGIDGNAQDLDLPSSEHPGLALI